MKKLIATLVIASVTPIYAANYYFTPTGAGEQTGTSWDTAYSKKAIQTVLSEQVKPGDRIMLGSGTYTRLPYINNTLLVVARGGRPGKPIAIEGVDTGEGLPVIRGAWKETNIRYHAHSATAISLRKDVSHVEIKGLRIENCQHGIRTSGGNRSIRIEDVAIARCREGFIFNGLIDSTLSRCQIVRYTKRGIRFEAECKSVTVRDVLADANAGDAAWPLEGFPFGFAVEDEASNEGFRFIRCVARNNQHEQGPKDYWNGDGFVVEPAAQDVSYVDCEAYDNTDGGWDDKSTAPLFTNCIAARNKRGFRIWNLGGSLEKPARLINCLSVYNASGGGIGSSVGLWTRGTVIIEHCTFHQNATAALGIENSPPGGRVTAENCIFSSDTHSKHDGLVLKESGTEFTGVGNIVWNAGTAAASPEYPAPSPKWNGLPRDVFNSRRYGPAKGYWAGGE